MRKLLPFIAALLVCGCHSTRNPGTSRIDAFEATRVDQMTGNTVSGAPFQRTLFCLNARRETRRVSAVTNQVVKFSTNSVVSYVTNSVSTSATNTVSTLATNQIPLPTVSPAILSTNEESAPVVLAHPAPEPANSGLTRTSDSSVSLSAGNNQSVLSLNTQSSVSFNNQSMTTHSNVAISTASSQLIRTESNQTVTAVTNFLVTSVTNQIILFTNLLIYDHLLYTEVTPPADFTLAPGDSLVLLVDGTRYAFSATSSTAAPFGRPGFSCTLYKVTPEVLVAIANAQEVRIRLRGVTSVIERTMNQASRQRFKAFLAKYYTPESVNPELPLRPLDVKRQHAKVRQASQT
jgi:hypothetical protein